MTYLFQTVHQGPDWTHLSGIQLADPEYDTPGRVDVLLGVDLYSDVLLDGQQTGHPDTPTAYETHFGWVLAGRTNTLVSTSCTVCNNHIAVSSSDDILRKF